MKLVWITGRHSFTAWNVKIKRRLIESARPERGTHSTAHTKWIGGKVENCLKLVPIFPMFMHSIIPCGSARNSWYVLFATLFVAADKFCGVSIKWWLTPIQWLTSNHTYGTATHPQSSNEIVVASANTWKVANSRRFLVNWWTMYKFRIHLLINDVWSEGGMRRTRTNSILTIEWPGAFGETRRKTHLFSHFIDVIQYMRATHAAALEYDTLVQMLERAIRFLLQYNFFLKISCSPLSFCLFVTFFFHRRFVCEWVSVEKMRILHFICQFHNEFRIIIYYYCWFDDFNPGRRCVVIGNQQCTPSSCQTMVGVGVF